MRLEVKIGLEGHRSLAVGEMVLNASCAEPDKFQQTNFDGLQTAPGVINLQT